MPLVAAVVVILAVVLVAGASRAGARSNRAVSPRTVTVVPGDTLWSIARSQKPSGDVRPLVAKIARLNNVGAQLSPGSMLVLP